MWPSEAFRRLETRATRGSCADTIGARMRALAVPFLGPGCHGDVPHWSVAGFHHAPRELDRVTQRATDGRRPIRVAADDDRDS